MSDDPTPNDLPSENRSAEHLPYGVDTIIIPFTWSRPRKSRGYGGRSWGASRRPPPDHVGQGYGVWERQLAWALKDARQTTTELALSALQTLREGASNPYSPGADTAGGVGAPSPSVQAISMEAAADAGLSSSGRGSPDSDVNGFGATAPDPAAAALASSPPSGASPLTDAGTTATADAGAAKGAAAGRPYNPTAPVPVVDDGGQPVLIPAGPNKGKPMLRPAGLDPHFFIKQGIADRSRYDARLKSHVSNPYGGGDSGPAIMLHEIMQLYKFKQGGEWDAQRVGGRYHAEYVDYATIAIGLYAASAGISRDQVLSLQDLYAMANSRFDPKAEMDKTYVHLPYRNVANTDLGYQLYQSGHIRVPGRS